MNQWLMRAYPTRKLVAVCIHLLLSTSTLLRDQDHILILPPLPCLCGTMPMSRKLHPLTTSYRLVAGQHRMQRGTLKPFRSALTLGVALLGLRYGKSGAKGKFSQEIHVRLYREKNIELIDVCVV